MKEITPALIQQKEFILYGAVFFFYDALLTMVTWPIM